MPMTRLKLRWLICTFVIGGLAPAAARDLSCPATITTAQTGTAAAPWSVAGAGPAQVEHWSGVVFSEGPLADQIILAPDDSQTIGGNRVDIYKFPASAYKSVFLSCAYESTAVMLTRDPKISGSVCRVTFVGVGDQAGPQKVECTP
jgi:hypothetical protein